MLPRRCCVLRKERRDINTVPTYPCSQLNPVSPTLPLTSALDRVGGQRHSRTLYLREKPRYPLYSRLGGPHGWSGRVRNISPPPRYYRQTSRPQGAAIPTELSRPTYKTCFLKGAGCSPLPLTLACAPQPIIVE